MRDKGNYTDDLNFLVTLSLLKEAERSNFLKEVELGLWTEEELKERDRQIAAEAERADLIYKYISNLFLGPLATGCGIYAGIIGAMSYSWLTAIFIIIAEIPLYIFLLKRCWTKEHEYSLWAISAGFVFGLIIIKGYCLIKGLYS